MRSIPFIQSKRHHRLRSSQIPTPPPISFIYYYSISPDTSQSKAEKDLKEYNHNNKTSKQRTKENMSSTEEADDYQSNGHRFQGVKQRLKDRSRVWFRVRFCLFFVDCLLSISKFWIGNLFGCLESCSNERKNEGDLVKTSC